MRRLLLPFLLLSSLPLAARTIEVTPGGTVPNLEEAARLAAPGDTILFRSGTYPGGQYVENLQGTADAWITILADVPVTISGGSNAWQLRDLAYVRIIGFTIEGQTGNGMNIDDGGTYETPAHHLLIERCTWGMMDASGNNDQLKMSGVDSFQVRECTFRNGSAGGSGIDMVGCHNGLFTGLLFENAGSNSIQGKGGTRYITIERSRFINGGARAINIGGSTGTQFFRPIDANYEGADIDVYSNVFIGGDAAVAYVGAVNCRVINNTIVNPNRWPARILQESTEPRFLQCGDNTFANNIVVIAIANPFETINIGSNTRPATFTYFNNLWYNSANGNWSGPNLPGPEPGQILNRNPLLQNPPASVALLPGSPAIGAGAAVSEPSVDFNGRAFLTPRSIGAIEGGTTTTRAPLPAAAEEIRATLSTEGTHLRVTSADPGVLSVEIVDLGGATQMIAEGNAPEAMIPLGALPSGAYLALIRTAKLTRSVPFMLVR